MPSPIDRTTLDHPALAADQDLAPLLRDPALAGLHCQRERQRVAAVLDQGGWGFTAPGCVTVVRPLPWDEQHFGYPCADLVRFYLAPGEPAGQQAGVVLDATVAEARRRGVTLLSARVPAAQIRLVHCLQQQGMLLVDTSLELATPLPLLPTPPVDGLTVRPGGDADLDQLAAIAVSFVGNRFHQDPRIPADLARGVYASWVTQAVQGNHGQLLLAELEGRVAGFTTFDTLDQPLDVGIVALVAVHPDFRGRRVLDPLMHACARQGGWQALVTSTQVSNHAAQRAFGRHGLKPIGARHIFHLWP